MSATESSDRDQQLADLLAEMTDSICRGEPIDFDDVCQQHPELADELRELWAALLLTDTAGTSQQEGIFDPDSSSARWRSLDLPITIGDYELIEEIGRGGMGVVFVPDS